MQHHQQNTAHPTLSVTNKNIVLTFLNIFKGKYYSSPKWIFFFIISLDSHLCQRIFTYAKKIEIFILYFFMSSLNMFILYNTREKMPYWTKKLHFFFICLFICGLENSMKFYFFVCNFLWISVEKSIKS